MQHVVVQLQRALRPGAAGPRARGSIDRVCMSAELQQ